MLYSFKMKKRRSTKIKKHFHKYFIPHEKNGYHPHFFRNTSLSALFVFSVFLLGISFGNFLFLDKTVLGANIATNVLVDMANNARVASGTQVLVRNPKLDLAASMKAEDMIRNKYFAHFSPDGTTPWYFMREAGYNFVYAGENLAINFFDSFDVQNAWMNSPTHRANLLNSKYKEIGMSTKEGMYQGANSIYIVQMFGTEARKSETMQAKTKVFEDSRLSSGDQTQDVSQQAVPRNNETDILKNDSKVKVVVKSDNYISFKNEDLEKEVNMSEVAGVETYSNWFERFIFNFSWYIEIVYFVIVALVSAAFLLRIFIEYEKQHHLHILYSLLALVVVLTLAFINYNLVILHLT